MSISRSDVLALLIAAGAIVASLVVWNYGKVDIGMTLRDANEMVFVDDVTPGGNAVRSGFYPGIGILDLTTTDGGEVERGEPIPIEEGQWDPNAYGFGEYGCCPEAVEFNPQTEIRLPSEAIPSARIQTAVAGDVDHEYGFVNAYATIDRGLLEYSLSQSIWISGIWLLIGGVVWRLLVHGLGGDFGRKHAVKVGLAVATPALIWPVVQVGTAAGVAAAWLVPAAVALVLGWAIAGHHPEKQWVQTARAGALMAAALLAILVVGNLTSPLLVASDHGPTLALVAAIGLIPAMVVALSQKYSIRDRARLGSLALIPAAAMTLDGSFGPDPGMPLLLLALLLGWQLIPIERLAGIVGERAGRVRSSSPVLTSAPALDSPRVATRDLLSYLLIGGSAFVGLAGPTVVGVGDMAFGAWALLLGVGLAVLVGFAVRRGFLGEDWVDVAVPLAAAVSIPVILANQTLGGDRLAVAAGPAALASLLVAQALSERHPDADWRRRLFGASAALAILAVLTALYGTRLTIGVIGLIALVPGVPIAFSYVPGEVRAMAVRLETLAVAMTPGVAATMLVPSIGIVLLLVWLIAIVVWRRFTLAPLLVLMQRSQVQRDLAVAAAETERARLAADLHDDALQQLTLLVRVLDEGGHKAEADEAREVATKLRSVVGDLRLPILDDLGAGAALEWLVERVEPLAGGPVKLERSDETRPPANVELAVFRVAQEALTNAIKHGRPPIEVRYDVRTDGRVTLAIDDAGEGIAAEEASEAPGRGHFGLANMQQRAEQIGALLDVRRWPAGGTRVALEWRPQGT
ncbi:MAG TPA: ATP-binding protein [Candidatus Limnocylindria bacterium]|nr:ATP-binding protein [Candidatus Limnocylindria bacterium]